MYDYYEEKCCQSFEKNTAAVCELFQVYCAQNIHETFQCVFNVLIMGDSDCLMTRHIASDLLRRLVVSETQTVCFAFRMTG